jgi:hypothetical protein
VGWDGLRKQIILSPTRQKAKKSVASDLKNAVRAASAVGKGNLLLTFVRIEHTLRQYVLL